MREIMKRKEDWTVKEISRADALELFKDQKFTYNHVIGFIFMILAVFFIFRK